MGEEAVADIGLIGLAVMGQNLVLNMNDHGYVVAVYNRTTSKVDDFLANEAKGTKIVGAHSIEELVKTLKRPRRVMLLVKAGAAVDAFIDQLLPYLEKGDIIIDGGNSHYPDTQRRVKYVEEKGFLYVGSGVSGGEEGARYGPSLMPGGSKEAWGAIKEIFQSVAAKSDGEACCDWVGGDASGHYVKMVHNGIEYGDMQLICEAYAIMSGVLGMGAEECAQVFEEWNKGELDSYLIEITGNILRYKDDRLDDGGYLVDRVMDRAMQKGTGKWTVVGSLDVAVPVTLIAEAVFSRTLSSMKEERVEASKVLKGPDAEGVSASMKQEILEDIRQALYASKIVSYAQGYMLLRKAAEEYDWELNYAGIALMWRGGCIIRSRFLGNIRDAYVRNPELKNLLLDDFFKEAVEKAQGGWRRSVCLAAKHGVAVPTFMTALAFYDGYRAARLPANLLQAQRDYFGAHTYERVDEKVGEFFHTDWTGAGGKVTSNAYSA
eukprot:GFKZ01015496.1.p1 GENE.GFKZ01015496.1~~GFKZ01015496.1.p1  ORF type:complete len:491 (-),score=78.03 GFKZ01015496.1:454-1926(-)